MRPELSALGSTRHDLLVIRGGILGACLAWDAALRGLKVALVERGELGGATSANRLRIVRGGLRCFVRGDLHRKRESFRERPALLRIAPRLVGALPIAIRSGIPGSPSRTGVRLGVAPQRRHSRRPQSPPRFKSASARWTDAVRGGGGCPLSKPCTLARRGGALWFDALVSRPAQPIRAYVRSATEQGGQVANTTCAERFISSGGRVLSVAIRDCQSGGFQEVVAGTIVLAAGPWTDELLAGAVRRGVASRNCLGMPWGGTLW